MSESRPLDTRPVVPLTNAQLLVAATRSLVGWAVLLIGALLPVMFLSATSVIDEFSASHSPTEAHGKGWLLLLGWGVFGFSCISYGLLVDLMPRFKSRRTGQIMVALGSLIALGLVLPTNSITQLGYLLVIIQIPSAIVCMIITMQLTKAKQKTGRGSASAIFAIGIFSAYFLANFIAFGNDSIGAIKIVVITTLVISAIGLLVNVWLKRHPGKPIRQRISKSDKKRLQVTNFIRFIVTNIVFLSCVYGIQYNFSQIANNNTNKKGVTLDQIITSSVNLYTVGSLAAVFGTVFFLFATERIERTYLIGTIVFGIATLMTVGISKAAIFVVIQSLSGFGLGIMSTTLLVLTITYFPRKMWRGRAVGLLFASIATAHIVGPIVSHFLIGDSQGSRFTAMLMAYSIASCATAGILHVTRAKPNDFHITM